jgi:hypothetical protein
MLPRPAHSETARDVQAAQAKVGGRPQDQEHTGEARNSDRKGQDRPPASRAPHNVDPLPPQDPADSVEQHMTGCRLRNVCVKLKEQCSQQVPHYAQSAGDNIREGGFENHFESESSPLRPVLISVDSEYEAVLRWACIVLADSGVMSLESSVFLIRLVDRPFHVRPSPF